MGQSLVKKRLKFQTFIMAETQIWIFLYNVITQEPF